MVSFSWSRRPLFRMTFVDIGLQKKSIVSNYGSQHVIQIVVFLNEPIGGDPTVRLTATATQVARSVSRVSGRLQDCTVTGKHCDLCRDSIPGPATTIGVYCLRSQGKEMLGSPRGSGK